MCPVPTHDGAAVTADEILDRAPKARDEEESFQTWIRRRDEYDGE
jgi:predicted dithiol-disulfide oxidoreductase (DUF899 family)